MAALELRAVGQARISLPWVTEPLAAQLVSLKLRRVDALVLSSPAFDLGLSVMSLTGALPNACWNWGAVPLASGFAP